MSQLLPVRDRPFTAVELERMRLLLSTFTDGSGQLVKAGYMPDFLAFERVTAFICGGTTTENKSIFDVLVPGGPGRLDFGISCKMATSFGSSGSWFMELSNSSKKFENALTSAGIEWQSSPDLAGPILVDLVTSWHQETAGMYDVDNSKYLLLVHDKQWREFEVACFSLDLQVADPRVDVEWRSEGRGGTISSIAGYVDPGDGVQRRLWQYFGKSGGQLKFYPAIGWEEWRSGTFELEQAPVADLVERAKTYWPNVWPTE